MIALRNVLIASALVILGGMAFADALPDQSTLVVSSGGTTIATGTYVGGNLTMDVLSGSYDGATLTVTTRGGDTITYTVDVTADSTAGTASITLTGSGTALGDINPSILERGGSVTLVPVASGTALTSPTLPAPGPDSHANANAFEHAGNATEGMDNASNDATDGAGGEHADDSADNGSGNGDH